MANRICTKCGLPNDTRMILLCRKCYRKEYALKNKVKMNGSAQDLFERYGITNSEQGITANVSEKTQ